MTIVVKAGGRIQSDPGLVSAMHGLWSANRRVCIVHGGGDEVSALQRQLGIEPAFIGGRRVTTADDVALVRMVLSGSANKRLVAALASGGIPSVGISGEDGGLITGEPIDDRFGRAGKPVAVDTRVLEALFGAGFLPVISPLATDPDASETTGLNINGDDAAAAIAAAFAGELWLVSDVDGVLDDNGSVLGEINGETMRSLVHGGTVSAGMQAKLEAGFEALSSGCTAVRIGGLSMLAGRSPGTSLDLTGVLHD